MKLSLIAAIAKNGVIGVDNHLPWRISEDLKRFRQITMGKSILMGRKTFESLPGILSGRDHIVLSRDANYQPAGCMLFRSLSDALKFLREHDEVVVIGGSSLYEECLPRADIFYLTLIDKEFAGDAFFPPIDWERWRIIEKSHLKPTGKRPFALSFLKMIKRPKVSREYRFLPTTTFHFRLGIVRTIIKSDCGQTSTPQTTRIHRDQPRPFV